MLAQIPRHRLCQRRAGDADAGSIEGSTPYTWSPPNAGFAPMGTGMPDLAIAWFDSIPVVATSAVDASPAFNRVRLDSTCRSACGARNRARSAGVVLMAAPPLERGRVYSAMPAL